jgi:hypothetical protein
MSLHRFHRRPTWVWPTAWLAAGLLLVAATLVPEAWWWLLIPDRDARAPATAALDDAMELVELDVMPPPPPVEAAPDPPPDAGPPPEVLLDQDWWHRAWNLRIADDVAPRRPTLPDSLVPLPLLALYGASASVDLILSQPDSVVQARLWWLVQEEQLTLDDLDGVFSAIAKARAFVDLKSREAAMFDEFIFETVPVTPRREPDRP